MPMSEYIPERERNKFVQTSDGNTSVRVSLATSLINFAWDYASVSYPNATTEVYTFKINGVSGTTVGTITVTYVDATKEAISTIARA
jgi:hypothetical protein